MPSETLHFENARFAQQREMMADGWLALMQAFAQRPHVQFVVAAQEAQHAQPRFIGQEFEDERQIFDSPISGRVCCGGRRRGGFSR